MKWLLRLVGRDYLTMELPHFFRWTLECQSIVMVWVYLLFYFVVSSFSCPWVSFSSCLVLSSPLIVWLFPAVSNHLPSVLSCVCLLSQSLLVVSSLLSPSLPSWSLGIFDSKSPFLFWSPAFITTVTSCPVDRFCPPPESHVTPGWHQCPQDKCDRWRWWWRRNLLRCTTREDTTITSQRCLSVPKDNLCKPSFILLNYILVALN